MVLSRPDLRRDDGKGNKTKFEFDVCFPPGASQDAVFQDVKRVVQSAIDGYNVCIFAYGQTGSGKTYTMSGVAGADGADGGGGGGPGGGSGPLGAGVGIMPRAVREIFNVARRDAGKFTFDISFYMLELYRHDLIDLLNDAPMDGAGRERHRRPKLHVHVGADGVVAVDNVTTRTAASAREMLAAVAEGHARRHTAQTKMNSDSSRSHLILSVTITATPNKGQQMWNKVKRRLSDVGAAEAAGADSPVRDGDDAEGKAEDAAPVVGKLTLVDLAGSERVGKTGASGEVLKEAQAINKSLWALQEVISALTRRAEHVPYRNHTLTQLMADSIGGNAKTLMFVCVSPADYNAQESQESLKYAERIKSVKNVAGAIGKKYKRQAKAKTKEVEALKKELERVKKQAKVQAAARAAIKKPRLPKHLTEGGDESGMGRVRTIKVKRGSLKGQESRGGPAVRVIRGGGGQ